MPTRWILHKGERILFEDFADFGTDLEKAREETMVAINLAIREPLDSILTLTDVHGTNASPEMFAVMRNAAAKIVPFARKRAVVGLSDVQRVFIDMLNLLSKKKTFTLFKSIEDAKDWLVR